MLPRSGDEKAADTPGITSQSMPRVERNSRISSPPRPNTNGSPILSLTTSRPPMTPSLTHSYISRWALSAHPGSLRATRSSPRTSSRISSDTSRSAITRQSSCCRARIALTVSSSGSPGPAPMSVMRPTRPSCAFSSPPTPIATATSTSPPPCLLCRSRHLALLPPSPPSATATCSGPFRARDKKGDGRDAKPSAVGSAALSARAVASMRPIPTAIVARLFCMSGHGGHGPCVPTRRSSFVVRRVVVVDSDIRSISASQRASRGLQSQQMQ
mmetsp:Transcript_40915/g.94264  ORF Transcript_40915/g.94264 Transcript_40915/m.94264 type:complete len:271 (+) Transcript_40915:799-1611(+)